MMGDITLGQYVYADSPVHKLDPRSKILLTIGLMVVIFLTKTLVGYAILAAFLLGAILLSRVPFKMVLRSLKPLVTIIVITFFINLLFVRTGNVLFEWWILMITDGGIRQAVNMALRILFLVASSSLLTLTTTPMALTDGIEKLLSPLKIVRFPAHELAMMMTIALRMIPTLLDEANKIMKAQMARGADFESGNIIKRAKAMIPVLVPLFVSAFRRADELAMAMESRCYHGGEGRTKMKVWRFHWADLFALLAVLALLGLILLWGR